MPGVLHVTASFSRRADDHVTPFLLDLARVQRDAGWAPRVVALHDAGLPARHEVDGVPVRRARYGTDRMEVLAYRGGLVHALPRPLARVGGAPASTSASPLRVLLVPVLLLTLVWSTLGELRRTKPDVVHAHWLVPGGFVVACIPRRWRPRTVLTMHGTDVILAEGRLGPLARWVVRRVDECAAVSADLARRAEATLGLEDGTVALAPMPLAAGCGPTPIPDGDRTVLAAGRASAEKGFDVLLDALARPEAALLRTTLVTEGPVRVELDAQVARLGLGDRVHLRPLVPRSELLAMMRSHHVVVVPSRAEGLGLVALEALAMGRPVVASAVGGLVALVGPGDGALVPPDDPGVLAAALVSVPLTPPAAASLPAHRAPAVLDAHRTLYGRTAG